MKVEVVRGKSKIDKKQFKTWIINLRSGKYKQARYKLQDGDSYCCLGVACRVLIPEDKLKLDEDLYIYGETPEEQKSPKWLKAINKDFQKRTGRNLIDLNDDYELSFNEIADCLQLVYIHGYCEDDS